MWWNIEEKRELISTVFRVNPLANGAKRRARVLIPPAIYTRGNESISEV
jgi:hypothetical protein